MPFQLSSVRMFPLGDAALVLQLGDEIAVETHHQVKAVAQFLDQHPFPGLVEYVPAFTTVTVYYDPWLVSDWGRLDAYAAVETHLRQMLAQLETAPAAAQASVKEIPVVYGGAFGPDLELVAQHTGLRAEEVIALHSQAEYLVYMIGFAPGFPYLGGMNPRLAAPRKQVPRAVIPAGSVGIAGLQTGVYPLETPGGWQLIGRTPLSLFDPARASPSLLEMGDVVRFVPVSEKEYLNWKERPHEH
ncbi:5-oxoprolinase subunit PxpB [Rufibacter sediminis]|uniref:5-oxoprolinase subunit PxpB n=1 Tax=Rufibacter sediminis TaxID=2762756 RepID=A0ABR6VVG7_9BACT|nr:5-oxoprolinase subunit PxpB [Rufibacter sediminis]MBC3540892.1 5-oxoprolinase subunit PxpB [Rufibacter sediminis]